MNPLTRFIEKYKYFLGIGAIVIGIIVGLFGKKLFKPTICIVGTLVVMGVVALFTSAIFLDRFTPTWVGWLIFGISFVLGAFVGLLLAKLSKIGVGVLAGWGGFMLGLMLYTAFVYKLDNSSKVVFWTFNIACAVICGVLSLFLFDHAIIIATSVIGSYTFIRGISFYAGGYPDEFDLANNVAAGNWDAIPSTFYAYMAGFFVASIICIVV